MSSSASAPKPQIRRRACLLGSGLFLLLVLVAWPEIAAPSEGAAKFRGLIQLGALLAAVSLSAPVVFRSLILIRHRPALLVEPKREEYLEIMAVVGAILLAALLLNLKRGPWMGVMGELVVLGLLLSRRMLVLALALGTTLVFLLAPAWDRLFSMLDHFTIQGGRMSMWQLGLEIAGRFPLGLGPDNVRHMRKLDPSLPELHRHMHNNLLSVAVESGWIGLAAYLWWIGLIIGLGFILWKRLSRPPYPRELRPISLLALCLGTALLGWQIAGLVEYNFGDSEIRLLAYLLIGILISLAVYENEGTSARTDK